MAATYSDYNRDRIGWFFGVSGWQLGLLAVSALPVVVSLQHGAWTAALGFAAVWVLVLVITVVVRRSRWTSTQRTTQTRWRPPQTA